MRRRLFVGLFLAVQLLVATAGWAQGSAYKVQSTALPSSSDIPVPLAAALEPQGSRVLDSTGATFCEVWLGKAVPLSAGGGSSADVMYENLAVGTLIGVLHFPKAGSDFRGQAIKPGYYTLRYALVPQDGNHMGVNPTRDFVLMSPVALDTNVNTALSFQDLVKLSKQASGTNHPAILTLNSASGGANTMSTSLVQDDQGHWVLQASGHGKTPGGQAQSLPLAVVVVGQAVATE